MLFSNNYEHQKQTLYHKHNQFDRLFVTSLPFKNSKINLWISMNLILKMYGDLFQSLKRFSRSNSMESINFHLCLFIIYLDSSLLKILQPTSSSSQCCYSCVFFIKLPTLFYGVLLILVRRAVYLILFSVRSRYLLCYVIIRHHLAFLIE